MFSNDQIEKLQIYEGLLKKWQKSINLISPNTLNHIWERHFEDSAQLSQHITRNSNVLDVGSGAGLPGIVLKIVRPDLNITMVEADTRKCAFLQNVSRETQITTKILNERLENIDYEHSYNIITSRAFASLEKTFSLSKTLRIKNPNTSYLLLKGQTWQEEIKVAQKKYSFEYKDYKSVTNSLSRILTIQNVSRETSF